MKINYILDTESLQAAIALPDLVQQTSSLLPTAEWYQAMQAMLAANRAALQPITISSPRLGYYFERLWAALVELHPDYQLVAENLPLYTANKITLGALDMLVHNQSVNCIEHWELAIKYYLQIDLGSEIQWVGPDVQDRLDLKWQRMRTHQLPLSFHPLTRNWLAERGLPAVTERKAILKGRLFTQADEQSLDGCWLDQQTFSHHQQAKGDWYLLPKPFWLRQLRASDIAQLTPYPQLELNYPKQLVKVERGEELMRCFVVDDGWLERAIQIQKNQR